MAGREHGFPIADEPSGIAGKCQSWKHEIRSLHYQQETTTTSQIPIKALPCLRLDIAVAVEPSNRRRRLEFIFGGPKDPAGPVTAMNRRANQQSIMAWHSHSHMQETARLFVLLQALVLTRLNSDWTQSTAAQLRSQSLRSAPLSASVFHVLLLA